MSLGKLIERLLQLVPVLLGVSLIVFVMMALTPGDPVQIMIGDASVTPEQEQALRHGLGWIAPRSSGFSYFSAMRCRVISGRAFITAARLQMSLPNACPRRLN